MEAYLIEWASLLLRWLHLIVGIAWIGASFYFVWLDNSLRPPEDETLKKKGVAGELWAVHGGGFYNPQKYLVAPATLPRDLHWFKWEAYSTWITGFLLIVVLYYAQAATWMVDPSRPGLTPAAAVAVGLATLAGGWLAYDVLCRLMIERSQVLFGILYYGFVVLMTWLLTQLLPGRAAFLHVGAMLATVMSANVFFWIIPGQKKTIAQMQRGETPDPIHGMRAKQRSVHNNYLTLPVLFCMISNHYAFTYGHPHAWAVLALILLAAVLIRHFFNQRHRGQQQWRYPIAGVVLLMIVAVWLAPTAAVNAASAPVEFARVQQIIAQRCAGCHAEHPTLMPAAPAGVMLDSPARIHALKPRIIAQAVQLKAMPLGNVTGITDDERALLARWGAEKESP
ncbi:MAG: urate hydroxylase PuuD [Betaproteobacteria bacterium]|nr:urate hydroxylase PuuD [Betaproteobacteria bacterium]